MYCELCKKNPATIHYTKIVNGYKEERHLCEQCANSLKEPGGGFPTLGLMPDFSMADFIGGFFNPESQSQPFVQKNMTAHDACPMCGMTAGEFRRVGRVGCSNCYSYFAEYMPGLIQRIHGNSRHTGKVPVRGEAKLAEKQKNVQLRQALQQAISEEQFERAAELRDEIRRLEQESGHNA